MYLSYINRIKMFFCGHNSSFMKADIVKSQLRTLYGEGNGLSSSKVYLHVQVFMDGFLMHNSHTQPYSWICISYSCLAWIFCYVDKSPRAPTTKHILLFFPQKYLQKLEMWSLDLNVTCHCPSEGRSRSVLYPSSLHLLFSLPLLHASSDSCHSCIWERII